MATYFEKILIEFLSYAFTADDAFILWMPFGAPLNIYNQWSDVPNPFLSNPKITAKPSKKFPNFSMKDCTDNFQKGDNGSVFTVCGAGSKTPGMARIYQVYRVMAAMLPSLMII